MRQDFFSAFLSKFASTFSGSLYCLRNSRINPLPSIPKLLCFLFQCFIPVVQLSVFTLLLCLDFILRSQLWLQHSILSFISCFLPQSLTHRSISTLFLEPQPDSRILNTWNYEYCNHTKKIPHNIFKGNVWIRTIIHPQKDEKRNGKNGLGLILKLFRLIAVAEKYRHFYRKSC